MEEWGKCDLDGTERTNLATVEVRRRNFRHGWGEEHIGMPGDHKVSVCLINNESDVVGLGNISTPGDESSRVYSTRLVNDKSAFRLTRNQMRQSLRVVRSCKCDRSSLRLVFGVMSVASKSCDGRKLSNAVVINGTFFIQVFLYKTGKES